MVTDIPIIQSGKAGIDPENTEKAIEARIPLFQQQQQSKAEYLSFRACGFSIREACSLAKVTQGTVQRWRRDDASFAKWESEDLPTLQHNLAGVVTTAKFYRNLLWGLELDGKVLKKAALNRGELTDFEQDYVKVARRQYDPQALLALEKATGPDHDDGDTNIHVDRAVIIVDGREVTEESAKRAAARQLLEQFNANRKFAEHPEVTTNLIEGEVSHGDGD